MPSLEKFLRIASFACAAALSAVASAMGVGIFLWGSTLSHPEPDVVLLCLGPALSFPLFMTALASRKWHRQIMWLLACASFIGAYLAIGITMTGHLHWKSTGSAEVISRALQVPPVVLSIGIAILVECSYQLKRAERWIAAGVSH